MMLQQHVSFWDFMLNDTDWQAVKESAHIQLQQPQQQEAKVKLVQQFHEGVVEAKKLFALDNFAEIQNGKLKLKRDDKAAVPNSVAKLQRVIAASLPLIRIEQLLMEVDQLTHFSQHFTHIQGHHAKPDHFYKTLMDGIISQATNLGVVSMSASVEDAKNQVYWGKRTCFNVYDRCTNTVVSTHHKPGFSDRLLGNISTSMVALPSDPDQKISIWTPSFGS